MARAGLTLLDLFRQVLTRLVQVKLQPFYFLFIFLFGLGAVLLFSFELFHQLRLCRLKLHYFLLLICFLIVGLLFGRFHHRIHISYFFVLHQDRLLLSLHFLLQLCFFLLPLSPFNLLLFLEFFDQLLCLDELLCLHLQGTFFFQCGISILIVLALYLVVFLEHGLRHLVKRCILR